MSPAGQSRRSDQLAAVSRGERELCRRTWGAAPGVGDSTCDAQPASAQKKGGKQADPTGPVAGARHPFHVNGNASCLKKPFGT
jgi:hypothetical protein